MSIFILFWGINWTKFVPPSVLHYSQVSEGLELMSARAKELPKSMDLPNARNAILQYVFERFFYHSMFASSSWHVKTGFEKEDWR